MRRLPTITPDEMNRDQEEFFNSVKSGPRGKFGGPFIPLLHAPDVGEKIQALGEVFRYHGTLDPICREIAILVVARLSRSVVEWNSHTVIAINAGVSVEILHQIRDQAADISAEPVHQAIYRYARELLKNWRVSDECYDNLKNFLSPQQLAELAALLGYYGMLAMVLNSFEIEAQPEDGVPPDELLLPINE